MNAAIYARKSTKQDDVADGAKSVAQQQDGAREFITRRGWALAEAHVYTDDNVSGALFADRAAFQHMMRDAAAGAFQHLVVRDLDRVGRHAHKTMVALNALADHDITVWDFSTGLAVDLDSFSGRITATLQAEFAQQFRDDIRKKTTAAMYRKAQQGYVTGGLTFGYTNDGPKGQRVWRRNEEEAAVVVRIFEMSADGYGAREIAKALNVAKALKPRAQQGRADGWSVSTVRAVLWRPLYRGDIVYGRTKKAYGRELGRDAKRERKQIRKPETHWVTVHNESLRIIDPDLAARVDARLEDRRTRYLASLAAGGKTAPHKTHGKYLLSGGMLVCPTCGGHFEARKYPYRHKPSPPVYMCATRRRKPGVCTNPLALPIADTDDTVLDIIEGEILGTRFIAELLALVDRGEEDKSAYLAADRERLQEEVARLVGSIAAGVPADTVAPAIKEREMQIARLDVKLRAPRVAPPDMAGLRQALKLRTKQWKAELRGEPEVARLVLRRLVGPLTLWDESERPDFIRWEAAPKTELLDGLAPALLVASPMGFEPVCGRQLQHILGAIADSIGRRLLSVPLAVRSRELGGAR